MCIDGKLEEESKIIMNAITIEMIRKLISGQTFNQAYQETIKKTENQFKEHKLTMKFSSV